MAHTEKYHLKNCNTRGVHVMKQHSAMLYTKKVYTQNMAPSQKKKISLIKSGEKKKSVK